MRTQIKDTMCKLLSPNNKTALQWNGNAKINVPKKELRLKQIYLIKFAALLLRKT